MVKVGFPYYNKVFKIKLSFDEINSLLKSFVVEFVERELFSNSYYGVLKKDGFELYKNSYFFNVSLVKVMGRYKIEDGLTKLNLTFTLSEYTWVISVLILLFLTGILIGSVLYADQIWLMFMPLIALMFVYFLVMLPFNLISKNIETKFFNVFKGKFK